MYEQKKRIIEQKIRELSDKAGLKPPRVKFSDKIRLASAKIFLNEITVGEYLISQWEKGIFEEIDVIASLAHEIGHRIDFNRNFHSVSIRHFFLLPIYATLLLILICFCSLLQFPISGMITLFVFAFWIIFLPWIIIRTWVPGELEADNNAIQHDLITAEKLALSIVKKADLASNSNVGPLETFENLITMLTHPTLSERLRNLGFEIKKPLKIQRIK